MIRTLLYKITDPPIWYQTIVLSLIGEQKLGLNTDFKSERNLDLWINFFTIVWILLIIVLVASLIYGSVEWYDYSHPKV